MSPGQPIKLSDLDKSRMKCGGLLNKHFCKKSNIPCDSAEIANFRFSHYKSMETISCPAFLSDQNKNIFFLFYYMFNVEIIDLMVSEEMSSENVDGQTGAGCRMPEPMAQVS